MKNFDITIILSTGAKEFVFLLLKNAGRGVKKVKMRKLASIQKIKEVMPIPEADRQELVYILGWKCVCGKGEFHVGDDLLLKYPDEAALLSRAEGIGYNGTTREGIVIRPVTPVHSYTLSGPLSIKVINNKYLMKHDE